MHVGQLKEELIQYANEIGVDKIRFASADTFDSLKDRLILHESLGYLSGFEEPDIEKRTNPALLLPKAKSIVAIALAYPSKMKDAPRSTKDARRGIFCRASWGTDYHVVLKKKLDMLEEFLRSKHEDIRTKSMVDTGELSDRAVAERAGIGFSAKNCMIITPEFGSYVYLAEMITNVPFEPDEKIEDQCGTCNKCVDSCPTGALVNPGQLNSQRCISFLTQTKGFLPDEFRSKIGNRLYGCDTCQTVCPINKGKDFHLHPEMEPDPEIAKPLLKPLLTISNREFKEKYGHVSGSWRGKKPIQRNAILALAHFKDTSALPDLVDLMHKDPRPVIRGTAAWAIGKIGDGQQLSELEKALERESDEEAKQEIIKGIELLQTPLNTK
ncbi:tRNA epoxyqueuosine(34) reductase QueG [Bacillus altitudinis]|uniref:tRNA epoxyqueuosine(34) reductase QueG n=3 Tax=Bacillus TaxID=1386 RepID=A0ABV1S811_BACAB|nr:MULTISPECIES: tRNA epoxyqueuosine(34) reductase QueG [Bacillus]AMM91095.1 epoxyqueuosine reductase [Bacillus pumilus]KML16807.1 epoxyqueuosine reductase [Bacillus stratosphericus]MBR0628019.1 tRNA epoxyqueuosine(34) reductase QueG [Bacillus altitudinis S70-5-12]MBR3208378.1 tRNA epoxyqueuosine(34) reductase QueG [Bacillus sp. (in: firmicutes)]MBU4619513.1 tRNA epoxyqueuosine(34) reductase QueG [Bacillus sp. GG161]MBW3701311.1 tRNA epoxyqueuosine(34) reductase QueG [Bacillus aerophilus]